MRDLFVSIVLGVFSIVAHGISFLASLLKHGELEIAWWIGWPVCRLITFGKLPEESITESEYARSSTTTLVSMIGLVSIFVLYIVIAILGGGD